MLFRSASRGSSVRTRSAPPIITCAKYVASNLKFFENQITYIQSSLVRLRKLDSNLNKEVIIRWVAKGMKIYFRKAKRLYI